MLQSLWYGLAWSLLLLPAAYRCAGFSGFLTSTLYTFPEVACDGETLRLRCPPSTMISIQSAEYGRKVPSYQLCSTQRQAPPGKEDFSFPDYPFLFQEDTNCLATTSFRVLLDKCQNRQHCHLVASSKTFRQDPCPQTTKYLKVSYKCNPDNYTSATVCEGEQMSLSCKRKSHRIAIYSALFGRSPQINPSCSDFTGYADCRSNKAVDEVMSRCHGRKRCAVEAEEYVFDNPCPPGIPKYLNIKYTCVPKKVLKQNIRRRKKPRPTDSSNPSNNIPSSLLTLTTTSSTTQSSSQSTNTQKGPDRLPADESGTRPDGEVRKEDLTVTGVTDSKGSPADGSTSGKEDVTCYNETMRPPISLYPANSQERAASGLVIDWFHSFHFLRENSEKAVLYSVLGVCGGLISLLLIVIGHLIVKNKRKNRAKLDVTDPVHPNGHAPGNHIEAPTLTRTDSIDRIEIVRFEPRTHSFSRGTLGRDFESHIPLRTDFEPDNTLRSDGDRSLSNYYG